MISALRHKSKIEFQTFLKKKIKYLGFHGVVLVKTFDVSITNVRLIGIDEAMVTSFLGVRTDRWSDRHGFGILIWKHAY